MQNRVSGQDGPLTNAKVGSVFAKNHLLTGHTNRTPPSRNYVNGIIRCQSHFGNDSLTKSLKQINQHIGQ
jgi:hypothetical protein